MFIKIETYDGSRRSTNVYECARYSVVPETDPDTLSRWQLTMERADGRRDFFSYDCEQDIVDIYVMSDAGKTIDRISTGRKERVS